MKTWVAACKTSTAPAKMLVPEGSFLVGPVVFQGPCKSSHPIIIEVLGTIKGTTDVSEYSSPEWFSIEQIDGLLLTGNGTFDGQGPKVWKYNDCKTNPDCQHLAAVRQEPTLPNLARPKLTLFFFSFLFILFYLILHFSFNINAKIKPWNFCIKIQISLLVIY